MRVGRKSAFRLQFAAEVLELGAAQTALEERARVDAGRGMRLYADQVAAVVHAGIAKEMVQADLHHRRGRRIRSDMTADVSAAVISAQDHSHRVPAQDVLDASFDFDVPGIGGLLFERNGVPIRRIQGRVFNDDVLVGEIFLQGAEYGLGSLRAVRIQYVLHGLQPLLHLVIPPGNFGAP